MKNTCSTELSFELDGDNSVRDIRFKDGCAGNLSAISILVDGMNANDIIAKLKGVRCGRKKTSCGDQFAAALELALVEEQ